MERRLAAILSTDMVGYSRLIEADEEGTLARQKAHRKELIDPKIAEYHGRIVKSTGDGLLAEFSSIVDAVRCAVTIQMAMSAREADMPEDKRIAYRVGINLGDIVIDGDDIYGDGVNIAARLEGLAEPGGICVSQTALSHVKGKVNSGFEDLGAQKLKNMVEPVQVYRVLMKPEAAATDSAEPVAKPKLWRWPAIAAAVGVVVVAAGALFWPPRAVEVEPASVEPTLLTHPAKASIAVLPLDNLSDDPSQEYFAEGLTEDLTTALSRVPELFVIARNSTETYKGKSVDVRRVAKDLGVRHVLEGSVQKSGDRLRVTAQLIDGTSGAHLWSERYDREVKDLFALQDEIVKQVLVALQVKLTEGDAARIGSRGTKNLEAWLLSVQASTEGFKFTPEGNNNARELYQAAHEADPNWANPLAGLAWTYREALRRGWSTSKEDDRRRGIELAQEAISMDPDDPFGYMQLGNLYIERGDVNEGIVLREKAVEIAPNDFYALVGLAWQLGLIGQERRALELYQRAKRVSPLYPYWLLLAEGFALHLDGQHERAIRTLRQSLERSQSAVVHARLAAVYADLDRIDEAEEEIKLVLEMSPDAKVEDFLRILNFQDPKRAEWYAGLLKASGLPG